MSDYKAEAGRIAFALAGHTVRARQVESDIAAALEAAEQRGRVAGLREAADMAMVDRCGTLADNIRRRAEEVEKS